MEVVKIKKVSEVLEIVDPVYVLEGAGVLLRRSIATATLDYVDPFLLFDHFGSENPRDYVLGFPMHPHRGIETVTYILNGHVDHKDSMGNAGTIGRGDIQWMTSGSGILHEEMPKEPQEGILEGFQLWLNLPKRLKMTEPRYRGVESSEIPQIKHDDGAVIKVIAGKYEGVEGAVTDIYADPTYLDVYIPNNSHLEIPVEEGHSVLAYVFEGEGNFGNFEMKTAQKGTDIEATKMIIFGEGNTIRAYAQNKPVRFLLISGKPLNEPIARYGPFVMNTNDEIEQALHDLQNNTFVK
jgi:redox-sensitive bicupin YhaK (pirin superfamily)